MEIEKFRVNIQPTLANNSNYLVIELTGGSIEELIPVLRHLTGV